MRDGRYCNLQRKGIRYSQRNYREFMWKWVSAGTALTKYSILVGPEPIALIGVVATTGDSLQ